MIDEHIKRMVRVRLEDWILDPTTGDKLNDEAIEYLFELISWAIMKDRAYLEDTK